MGLDLSEVSPSAEPTSNGQDRENLSDGRSPIRQVRPDTPRMSRHEHWLKVPAYEAEGFEVLGWTNFTQGVLLDLDSHEPSRYLPAIRSLVRGCRTVSSDKTYDSWFDADGNALPTPDAPEFIDKVPTELLGMAVSVIRWEGPHLEGALFLARVIAARRGSG
jgi:hypothetical protein